jgi:hypothetical protein
MLSKIWGPPGLADIAGVPAALAGAAGTVVLVVRFTGSLAVEGGR